MEHKKPRAKHSRHGLGNTKTYRTWRNMKNRCHNPNHKDYPLYGGRGIFVCEAWLLSFDAFLADMGLAPEGYSIDRINVNQGYSRENCRWATPTEQSFNQRMKGNNTSGRTGVYYRKKLNKWLARIAIHGKLKDLGLYCRFEDAAAAREKAEIELYGYTKK